MDDYTHQDYIPDMSEHDYLKELKRKLDNGEISPEDYYQRLHPECDIPGMCFSSKKKRSNKKKKHSKRSNKKHSKRVYKKHSKMPGECSSHKLNRCGLNPNCTWRKRVGCVNKPKTKSRKLRYEGPMGQFM